MMKADAYCSSMLRASVWVDATFRAQFAGWKTGRRAQAREWPRSGAEHLDCNPIPADEVPIEILHATYEAALRELGAPGGLSPDYVAAERIVREKIGPIDTSFADGTLSAADLRPVVTLIDDILAGLIGRRGAVVLFGPSGRG